MMRPAYVTRAMAGADLAILLTSVGPNDDSSPELEAATVAVDAAEAAGLPHLPYVSLVGIDTNPPACPCSMPSAKLSRPSPPSSVAGSSVRTRDIHGLTHRPPACAAPPRPVLLPHPAPAAAQPDLQHGGARLALRLAQRRTPLNRTLDIVDSEIHTPASIAALAGRILDRTVIASGVWPLIPLRMLRPLLRRKSPRLASITTLLAYLAHHDLTGDSQQLQQTLPGFQTASLETHLQAVLTPAGRDLNTQQRRRRPRRRAPVGVHRINRLNLRGWTSEDRCERDDRDDIRGIVSRPGQSEIVGSGPDDPEDRKVERDSCGVRSNNVKAA